MLNPTHKRDGLSDERRFIASENIKNLTVVGNGSFDAGIEFRLHSIYGDQIWRKLLRAGITPEIFKNMNVLEVCAGSGFLAYHLLNRTSSLTYTLNDISELELQRAKSLLSRTVDLEDIEYIHGNMYEVEFSKKFDLIIGNSFLHHFYDVTRALKRIRSFLANDGIFMSCHEPTPMATVLESGKILAYPFALFAPKLVNEIARYRHKGAPSDTDIWMFSASELERLAIESGYGFAHCFASNLFQALTVNKYAIHLAESKPILSPLELQKLELAIDADLKLARFLPSRFFSSLSLVATE